MATTLASLHRKLACPACLTVLLGPTWMTLPQIRPPVNPIDQLI